MDYSTIAGLVTSVGFPIVMCGAMAWYVKYQSDRWHDEIDTITLRHKEEMESIKTVLENNTLALTRLTDMIGGSSKDE